MEVAAILAIILLDYPDFCLIIGLLVMNATISYREEASADKASTVCRMARWLLHILRRKMFPVYIF